MRKMSLICVAVLLLSFITAPVARAGTTISLRLEGRDKTLYCNGALAVGEKADATMRDVVFMVNATSDAPKLETVGSGAELRISAVGSLKEGSLEGPFEDGWLIRVNGRNVGGGLDAIRIKAGDDIVVYYGDATLIQYPRIDLTRMMTDGIVRFISDDVTDAGGASYMTENPIVGATVVWDGMTYLTNMDGEVIIDSTGAGVKHSVSIERYYRNGLPTVLRFSPGYSVIYRYHDVSPTDWFYDAVMFVSDRNLLNGVTETDFKPDAAVSRAVFVTVLGRLAGAEVDQAAPSGLSDVEFDGWSSGYIVWAVQNRIADSRADGTFGPDENLTNEQLVGMLYRLAAVKGFDTGADGTELAAFDDAGDVSPDAFPAMAWGVRTGIVTGMSGRLDPKGAATRAQAAAMLKEFITDFMP